jgi:hypothetical protein
VFVFSDGPTTRSRKRNNKNMILKTILKFFSL